MKKTLLILAIAAIIIVVILISAVAAINFDLSSVSATGSETLNPSGTSVGRALVVYSPGFSGAAKQDATKIADDFVAKGYTVDLAGVRSGTASNKTGYNIIVAGGPMYFGQVSSSIDEYVKTLPNNVKIGVFGATGTSTFSESDFTSLQKQVASDTHNQNVTLKLVLDGNETNDCIDFVSVLVQ